MPFHRDPFILPSISVLDSCNVKPLYPYSLPGVDRVGGPDDVHAGVGKSLKRAVCIFRVIDNPRNHHRGGAILKQVDFLREGRV